MPEQHPQGEDKPSIYLPYGASGGGGEGGDFVFTDLDEFDSIVTDLEALIADIKQDGFDLQRAADVATPPAEDSMSTGQATAYRASLDEAGVHNAAMASYAENQRVKLTAARQTYSETDIGSAARLRSIDETDQ